MVDTALQHCVDIGDCASGLAERGGRSSFCVPTKRDHHIPQPRLVRSLQGWWVGGSIGKSNLRFRRSSNDFRLGCGTVDLLYNLIRVLEVPWEFTQPTYMAFDHVHVGVLWRRGGGGGLIRKYGHTEPLIWAVQYLYPQCQSLVR